VSLSSRNVTSNILVLKYVYTLLVVRVGWWVPCEESTAVYCVVVQLDLANKVFALVTVLHN
jgi:hypothetical protein